MKEKIYNTLNNIVPSDSQKEYMFKNIINKNKNIGGYIIRICTMAACFIFTFLLFSDYTNIENNKEPRAINYSCYGENCDEIEE